MEGLIEYPFQLRPDLFVYLRFPANLTREEVARVSAFLELVAQGQRAESPQATDPGQG